jgi:S-adenosylmethionine synthetase
MKRKLSAKQIKREKKEGRMPNKVLITGASGVLGRSLVHTFTSNGWEVTGLAHSRAKEGDKHNRRCDLTEESQIKAIFDEVKPDVVVHW